MRPRFVTIPSLIERSAQTLISNSSAPETSIQLYEGGASYLIGDLALVQGYQPYRNINSSPADIDYQLLAKAGLLIASGEKSGEIVVTTGFPFTTFELYRQQAIDFFSARDIFIEFTGDARSSSLHRRIQLTVKHAEVLPEIVGCIKAIRKGVLAEQDNFFVVSLGYGTCETGLSIGNNLVSRTCTSVSGLRHAVNNMQNELARTHNVGLKNEHMINQSFQSGKIVLGRKRKDLTDLRRNHLANYYDEIVSPAIKKVFTDSDFEKSEKLYLVGGGAMYPDLVDCFRQEFNGILNVIVPEEPAGVASFGYYLRSLEWCGPGLADQAVGLDIGNAYTNITVTGEGVQAEQEKPEVPEKHDYHIVSNF